MDPRKRRRKLVALYHQLRNVAPVYQATLPHGNPWIVTRWSDAETLVRDPRLVKDGRLVDMVGLGNQGAYVQNMRRMLAFAPRERHLRLRHLVNRGFTVRKAERLRPGVRELVGRLIDERWDAGGMDLVADYAFRIPMTMICELLGAPVEDVPTIEGWAAETSRRGDESIELTPENETAGDEATEGFWRYFQDLIEQRRRSPRDDLISELVEVQKSADDLEDLDIVATAILLFQAGHETTANMIGKAALALIENPDQRALLRDRPELIAHATEEFLRYDTPVQLSVNFADADVPFHGRTIRDGDPVMLFRGAINHDPERFDEPDRLNLEREDLAHHSFGLGAHFCLGASLARVEIQEAVSALVRRLPDLRLASDDWDYKPQLHLHGLESLPVAWAAH